MVRTSLVAGVLMSARLGSAQPSSGEGYEMNVIAACIIGFDVYGGVGFQVDNAITLSAFSPLWKYLGWAGYALVLVIMLAIPQIQYLKNKKGYWLAAEDWEQYKEVMGEDL